MQEKSGRGTSIVDRSRCERKDSRWPNLAAAGRDLGALAEARGTVDKGFRTRGKLEGHQHRHRKHADNGPPPDAFYVFEVKDRRNDEDEREMQEIGTKSIAGHEDNGLNRKVWQEHNNPGRPRQDSNDCERNNIDIAGKNSGTQSQEIDHQNNRIADEQKGRGKLWEDPFAENTLKDEQPKIEPDETPDIVNCVRRVKDPR